VRTFVPEGHSESSPVRSAGNQAKRDVRPASGRDDRNVRLLVSLSDCQHWSIVPSGTDTSLKTLTQSGSCRILGYFRQVPTGRPRITVGRDDHVKTGLVNKVIQITGHQSLLTVFLTDQVRPLSGPTQRRLDHPLPRSYRHPVPETNRKSDRARRFLKTNDSRTKTIVSPEFRFEPVVR
jgi:hypothetical protein